MTRAFRVSHSRRAIALAFAGLLFLLPTGCSTQSVVPTHGLADVTPTGPEGEKCYERCAQAKVYCDHMCPHGGGICQAECVSESMSCLAACPELQRHALPTR